MNPATGKSVLYNYKTTALLKSQEMSACYLTCLWLKNYYRTYPVTVEDEVKTFLVDMNNFLHGNSGLTRDTTDNTTKSFSVLDRNYLTARWPGDIYLFANEFLKLIR